MSRHPEERLGPYLEGELGPDERRLLELHLQSCQVCSAALRELRATVDLVHTTMVLPIAGPQSLSPYEVRAGIRIRFSPGGDPFSPLKTSPE